MAYCDIDLIKNRLLIEITDEQFDDNLEDAADEASTVVDMYLKPYEETLPLADPDDMIQHITADFASGIFKRRLNPDEIKLRGSLQVDMINDVDGSGWFAVAFKRLQDYIKVNYTLAVEIGNTVHNPDTYIKLLKDGVLTPKEAREFIRNASSIANTEIDTIVSTKSITETVTKVIREDTYKTNRQNSFGFVESDPTDRDAYKVQDDEEEE